MLYTHILDRVIGVPLAIEPSKLTILTEEVFLKLAMEQAINREMRTPETPLISAPNNMAVFAVHGSLVNKNGAGGSGLTSYESLTNNVKAAINNGAKVIGLDISSGGGEALGMFEFGNFFASLPEKYGVQTFSFTNSTAASAAYGLAAAAQKIYAVDTAMVGSIGVVMTLFSSADAEKKAGIEYVILRSKEEKALFNPHEKISENVIADAQKKLEVMDTKFTSYISNVRPAVTKEIITNLKGNTLFAEEAKTLNLVDEIVTSLQDVFDFYAAQQSSETIKKPNYSANKTNLSIGITKMTLEEALLKIQALETENETLKASNSLAATKAQGVERSRCVEILKAGSVLNINAETVLNAITGAFTLEQTSTLFSSIRSSVDAAVTANINTNGAAPNAQQTQQHLQQKTEETVSILSLMGMAEANDVKVAGGNISAADILKAMQTQPSA